ncbi:hypothetical protein EDD15DRAFT_2325033 [Pisolithus albus]|nr:hypothetical protein EDD15DRAFT_2325033 [Pisolithus albus]
MTRSSSLTAWVEAGGVVSLLVVTKLVCTRLLPVTFGASYAATRLGLISSLFHILRFRSQPCYLLIMPACRRFELDVPFSPGYVAKRHSADGILMPLKQKGRYASRME